MFTKSFYDEPVTVSCNRHGLLNFGRGVRGVAGFAQRLLDHFVPLPRVKLLFQAAQGDSDHIAMPKFRAFGDLIHFEPQIVHQVDIFRPELRRMRAEVEVGRLLAGRVVDFERERRSRIGSFSQDSPTRRPCSAGVILVETPATMRDDCSAARPARPPGSGPRRRPPSARRACRPSRPGDDFAEELGLAR